MKYREFCKDGWNVSVLGFGAMRLPYLKDGSGVDVELSVNLIRYGIDKGINYIDTAYVYHNGDSEGIVARALADGYRRKVRIATKSPLWKIQTADDFDRILDEQLLRLKTTCIDYYMFHGIGAAGLKKIKDLDLFTKMENAKKSGKVGHIGFSFHDDFKAFKSIIDSYDKWEFCQIQYNYMDITNQAGTEGLKYAASKGISVVVMEGLLGGRLARPPKTVSRVFHDSSIKRQAADWALQWIWNHPEVSVVLSGMNSLEQLDENIASADTSKAGSLSELELKVIDTVRGEFNKRTVIPCTKCRYCEPCPSGVNIPWNLEQYNEGIIYGDPSSSRFVYNTFINPQNRASACVSCKICEEKCPQKIKISEWMPQINAVLGENRPYPFDVAV
ncbi:MAG: aldo/keto reductase [Fibrobacter sp.]|nr:aldo/keto reductase [Fibrobacter sp.]